LIVTTHLYRALMGGNQINEGVLRRAVTDESKPLGGFRHDEIG